MSRPFFPAVLPALGLDPIILLASPTDLDAMLRHQPDTQQVGQHLPVDAGHVPLRPGHAPLGQRIIVIRSTWKARWYSTMTGEQVGDTTNVSEASGALETVVLDIESDRALVLRKQ